MKALVLFEDTTFRKFGPPPAYTYIKISGRSFADIERDAEYVENELRLRFDNKDIRVIVFTKYPGGTKPL